MKIPQLQLSFYYQFWVFVLVHSTLVCSPFIPLYTEAQKIDEESTEIQLEEEKIQIIDTTKIVLVNRTNIIELKGFKY